MTTSKHLRRLRRLEAGMWTDGYEIFYFPEIDEGDNLTVVSVTLSDLTASRMVTADAAKKLVSTAELRYDTATDRLGLKIAPEERVHVADSADDNIHLIDVYSTTNQHCGYLRFRKSATNTIGTETAVGTGDWLGYISFQGVGNAGTYAHGAYIKCVQNTLNLGNFVACALEMGASDKDGNINGEIYIDGNTGYIGLGKEYTPCSTVEIADYTNVLTLTNTNRTSDIEGSHGSSLVWRGFLAGGGIYDSHSVGELIVSHEGTDADEKGQMIIELNSGSQGYSPRRVLKLSSHGEIDYVSGINAVCNDDDVICYNDEVVFSHPLWVYGQSI